MAELLPASNQSVMLLELHEYLLSNNISEHDITQSDLLFILASLGYVTLPDSEGLDEGDLEQFRDYQVHKLLLLTVPPILLFIGTIGNILSFFILRHKTMTRLSTNTFLAALSIADSLVLIIGLLRKWLGEITHVDIIDRNNSLCKIVNVLGSTTSQYSVWLIVAVTIERYIVICHPLRATTLCNIPRARKVVVLLSLVFLPINSHFLWTIGTTKENYRGVTVSRCEGIDKFRDFVVYTWPWIDAFLYSLIPTIVIILSNILIIRQVIRATLGRDFLQNGPLIKQSEKRRNPKSINLKLTIMLLTISFTFLLTTLPITMVLIVNHVRPHDNTAAGKARMWLVRTVAELLMYLNHSINFFLYCATGQKFRSIVFRLVCRRSVSNTSNASDHSQHLYCSRTNGNACSQVKLSNETAM